jgi:hypothetical protein
MPKKFKPSAADCLILRNCAIKNTGAGVIMRPGYRHHYGDEPLNRPEPAQDDLNISHYTNMAFPEWEDTDLSDNCTVFADFKSGRNATLTEDGKGIFDFYLYKRSGVGRYAEEELDSNLVAYYEDGKLARVECTGLRFPLWKAGEGYTSMFHGS